MVRGDEQALDPPVVPAVNVTPFGHDGGARHNTAIRCLGYPVCGERRLLERTSDTSLSGLLVSLHTFGLVSFLQREVDEDVDVGCGGFSYRAISCHSSASVS